MKKFALLRHTMPAGAQLPSHWDLLLEQSTGSDKAATNDLFALRLLVLPKATPKAVEASTTASAVNALSGALQRGKPTNPSVSAERLIDHRRHYLTYEGPVSGNRGEVKRVASGTYERFAYGKRPDCRQLELGGRIELYTQQDAGISIFDLPPCAVQQHVEIVIHAWCIINS
ncbi:MAG TPA: hypothetical protein DDW52_11540 [Planctomycetaceae bacterium]|nr:hypothetical protein [Planctomycetaceae bacterium]